MITTSSSSSTPDASEANAHTVSLFPTYTTLPCITPATLDTFIRGFVLPRSITSPHIPISAHASLLRSPSATASLPSYPITHPHIQICGHAARDSRCGILGPLLAAEFTEKFGPGTSGGGGRAEISLISHIGGHKFAGNVIVYVPPKEVEGFERHALAGCGIWYGRVEPKHVQGIVEETVRKGVIIKELFRGGIDGTGRLLKV